jgi:hypothetical protein
LKGSCRNCKKGPKKGKTEQEMRIRLINFFEATIKWNAVKSVSLRLISDSLFMEMAQHAGPDFPVPVYDALTSYIKRLSDVYRQTPNHQEKGLAL